MLKKKAVNVTLTTEEMKMLVYIIKSEGTSNAQTLRTLIRKKFKEME